MKTIAFFYFCHVYYIMRINITLFGQKVQRLYQTIVDAATVLWPDRNDQLCSPGKPLKKPRPRNLEGDPFPPVSIYF